MPQHHAQAGYPSPSHHHWLPSPISSSVRTEFKRREGVAKVVQHIQREWRVGLDKSPAELLANAKKGDGMPFLGPGVVGGGSV